jgi:hypothetical protein
VTHELTIPYSPEAVATLVAIERSHMGTKPNGMYQSGWCPDCYLWESPCPTLTSARTTASEETRIAVALLLLGETVHD